MALVGWIGTESWSMAEHLIVADSLLVYNRIASKSDSSMD
jgi:hypothetical protein